MKFASVVVEKNVNFKLNIKRSVVRRSSLTTIIIVKIVKIIVMISVYSVGKCGT